MKYVLMCGGYYNMFDKPKQMIKIGKEMLFERTLRLLRENGVTDIAISSNRPEFEEIYPQYDVEFIKMNNKCTIVQKGKQVGCWLTAFPDMGDTPACYLFCDVLYSPQAIKTIVETETDDIEFFASAPPFGGDDYHREWAEPFGFKVVNQRHFRESIMETILYDKWYRPPIAWELWQVIKDTPRCVIDYTNYTAINDYTCDIDYPEEIAEMEEVLKKYEV